MKERVHVNMKKRKGRVVALYIIVVLCVANVYAWGAVFASNGHFLTVSFLDVGQGDAIFIESPSGLQVLVDSGPNIAVLRELGSVMPFYDRDIDMVVASHPDADHIGGFPELFSRYEVHGVVEPGSETDTALFKQWKTSIEDEGSWYIHARRGQVYDLGGGATLHILFPDRDTSHMKANTSSIVARLVYGQTDILLMGDAPSSVERYVMERHGQILQSDVLKVGHHGSRTSSSEAFLVAVSPEIAIIQAGKENRYGHPHQEVLNSLSSVGAAIFGTYESGRIVLKSDGQKIYMR